MKIELFLDEDVHSGLAHNQVFQDRADIERLENDRVIGETIEFSCAFDKRENTLRR